MAVIKCKTCDTGTLVTRKKYRMSGIVVFIGYIILIPSVFGILVGVLGLIGSGSAGSSGLQAARTKAEAQLRTARVPALVISKLTESRHLVAADTAGLTGQQRAAVRNADLELTASAAGTGIGVAVVGGASIFIVVMALVGGLVGWLLIMKKRVLQCDHCGAVVAAS